MRLDLRLVGVGLFFIVFGGVLLAARQGWVSPDAAARAWQLWPLLLVGIGINVILRGRPGAEAGGLLVAACLGAMAAGFVSNGAGLPVFGCGREPATSFAGESGEVGASARVEIVFNCGDLDVRTSAGSAWSIQGTSGDGRAPEVLESDESLRVESRDDHGFFGFGGARERWSVTLPADPTLELELTLNAGEGTVDLAGAHLGPVGVVVNAGTIHLDLGDVAAIGRLESTMNAGTAVLRLPSRPLEGQIVVNAGALSICAPGDVGLRLATGDNPISSNDFGEAGLMRNGDAWESPDYSTAPIRIALDVQANAGSLSLNPARDCAG